MTNMATYYNNASTVIPVTSSFTTANGSATNPGAVSCVVTDPVGTSTTYTWAGATSTSPNVVYNPSLGNFEIDLQLFSGGSPPPPGLWQAIWIGTGGSVAQGAQIFPKSFRVFSVSDLLGHQRWYAGLDELKSRLSKSLTATTDDYELTRSLAVASSWINDYCKTNFFQVQETRTFAPSLSVYHLTIDQHVAGSITSFRLDIDGDGVYETVWTEGVNFQTFREGGNYNKTDAGTTEPFDFVQVILGSGPAPPGGQFLPFVWPFTPQNRVQITATWGWPQVPWEVSEACLILAAELFKAKDAPQGSAGTGDIGVMTIQQNPWLVELLRRYIAVHKKVGV